LKTGWKRPDKRKDRIRMEKKGQRRRPSNKKDTRKRSKKYLNTRGLNVFFGVVAGLSSIYMILEVHNFTRFLKPTDKTFMHLYNNRARFHQ
jgi:hypothetical protein